MKNIIIGMYGGLIFCYTIAICLSLYVTQIRKNELLNCISEIVWQTMDCNFVPDLLRDETYVPASAAKVKQEIEEELSRRIAPGIEWNMAIPTCDMDKGILSVRVEEQYLLPNGKEKTWYVSKTVIVE